MLVALLPGDRPADFTYRANALNLFLARRGSEKATLKRALPRFGGSADPLDSLVRIGGIREAASSE